MKHSALVSIILFNFFNNLAQIIDGIKDIRDEVNASQMKIITKEDLSKIEHYKGLAVNNGQHLAIHLNGIFSFYYFSF